MSQKPSAVALRASLLYAVIAGSWILFSDRLLAEFIGDRELIIRLEVFKGWFFVAFTAVLFFLILRQLLASEQEKRQELKAAEALTKLQKDSLEMIARGKPLKATLETLLRGIEAQVPEALASILLLDVDGVHLRHGAAPSLPEAYLKTLDGVPIGPKAGSCGTAAFRGSPVFVSDIAQDPLWSDYKHLALPHGLRACWSTPIFDEQKKVLGTFAIYQRQPGLPAENLLRIVELVTHTAATAIVKARTEQSLRESEERFRTLVEQASDAIFVLDTDGRVLDVNEQACASLGYSRAELLQLAVPDFDLEFSPEAVHDIYHSLQPGQFKTVNGRHRRQDGLTFPVEVSLSAHRLHGRELTVALVRNVTERREYEEKLAASEESYRNFFNTIGDAIYVLDETGKFLAVNAGAVAMYGRAKEEFIGRTPEFLSAPGRNDLASTMELIQRAFAGEPQQFDWWGLRKNGEIFPKDVRLEKGAYFGRTVVFASGRDITRRRQAEAELRNERELLRTLIDLAPDFIFVKDTESRYLVANTSLAGCYGQTPGQMLGHTDADFLPAKLAAHFRASELQVMAATSFCAFEDTISFPDGKTRTVVTNMVAFHDSQGKVSGLVGIGRDVTGQKSIEKSMRLQSVALEAAANAILITDHNGSIEWVNPAFTRSTGYTLAESLGKNPRELLRSGQHDREFYQQLWSTILAGQIWHGEIVNRRKDGSLNQEEMTITPLLDRENRTTHFIAIRQDITERKRLEEELRAASERTKFYMNRMPLGFIAWDRDFRAAEWNAAAEAMFGWLAGEAIGRHAYELIVPPDVQPQVDKVWEQLVTIGNPASHSINDNVTRDGRRITCEWRNTPWRDASGQICGMLSIVGDITEQKLAEEKFAREQTRFKLIFDTMPVGIAYHNIHPDGSITRLVNEAHLRICGLTREQSNDFQNYVNITHPDDRASQKKLMAEINADQVNRFTIERRYVHPDKSVVWVNLSFQRETHPDGTIEELTTVVDITELKRLEEQLRQSQKMEAIGQLSGGVAHDFNNILTAILGNATLLSDPQALPGEIQESAREIIRATHRAADLTRQLLLFSRKQTMQPATVDLNHIVSQSIKMLRRILGEDITLHSEPAPGLPPVFADSGMIEQVILNLAVNARDAMPDGGRLKIRTRTETVKNPEAPAGAEAGPHVCLTVTDNGSGIAPEILPRIFEPFFTTKEVGKGTGLGLATVYGIVRQHNGWITVSSQPGQGATFQIYLPTIAGTPPNPPFVPAVSQLPRGTGTILVVEDEPAVRSLVCQLLQRLGYAVIEATNGAEGVAAWQQHRETISLVLTDIIMPGGMSGHELAAQLLAGEPRLKIIYISGYTGNPAAGDTPLVEGGNFIRKPFDPGALAEIVRKKLQQPATMP